MPSSLTGTRAPLWWWWRHDDDDDDDDDGGKEEEREREREKEREKASKQHYERVVNAMKTNNKSGSERHTRQGAQWRRLRDVYCTSAARPRTRDDRTQQTSKTEKRAEEDVWQCEKERDRRRRRLQWRTRRESLFAIAATPCLYRMTRTSNCEAMEAANHQAEVRQVIASVIEENRPKLPAILRLAFHDAGTFDMKTGRGGANGSIRLELDRPENAGLKRATRVIDSLYKEINSAEPGAIDSTVPSNDIKCSYADIIAISGAIAVEISGGPRIDIGMGRIDAIEADANDMLPQENASSAELKSIFQRMGLSTKVWFEILLHWLS